MPGVHIHLKCSCKYPKNSSFNQPSRVIYYCSDGLCENYHLLRRLQLQAIAVYKGRTGVGLEGKYQLIRSFDR